MDIRKILALAVIFSFAGSMAFAAEEAPKKNEKMPQKIEGKIPPAPEHAGKPDGKKMFQAPGMEKGMKGCPMHEKGEKMCQNCKNMDRKEAKKDHGWDKDRKPDFKKNVKFSWKRRLNAFPYSMINLKKILGVNRIE